MTTTSHSHLPAEFIASHPEKLGISEAISAADSLTNARDNETEEVPLENIWAAYGELGGEETQVFGVAPELPVATPTVEVISENVRKTKREKIGKAATSSANKFLDYEAEMREAAEARFGLRINREAITNILNDHPELLQYRTPGKPNEEELQRQIELQHMLDNFAKLPENLHFEPGITLVVGENGSGKSTLNRALQITLKIRSSFDMGFGGDDFDKFKESELNPSEFQNQGSAVDPSIFSLLVAEHIDVSDLVSFGKSTYLDATGIYGAFKADAWGQHKAIETNALDSYARSHSQFINDGLFGYLKKEKDSYERSLKRDKERRSLGPEVVFLDEVENGLSPKNHRNIKAKINEHTIEGSIVISATNSEVLYYDPTVARIDLEHPELGIHNPGDHPEIYDLNEFTER